MKDLKKKFHGKEVYEEGDIDEVNHPSTPYDSVGSLGAKQARQNNIVEPRISTLIYNFEYKICSSMSVHCITRGNSDKNFNKRNLRIFDIFL